MTQTKLSAEDVAILLRSNDAPPGITFPGKVSLAGATNLRTLPENLTVGWLDLTGCRNLERLPRGLNARRLTLAGAGWDPASLLEKTWCYHLELNETRIEALPDTLRVEYRLDVADCAALQRLPDGLTVGCLNARGCVSLRALPENLSCYFLDISGCTALDRWPEKASVSVGRLSMRGCLQFKTLPPWLTSIAQLDLRDCVGLREVPDTLTVGSWIDVAGTKITSLPKRLDGVQIRWRGVLIDARIAFLPETITAEEILAESNAERRRVLLERMGYEAFLTATQAETLDEDRDPGGPRRLLRVALGDDEPLVCVSVICPSTGRQYVIRVPPTTTTCHQAAAWIAGFDDPDEYNPLAET